MTSDRLLEELLGTSPKFKEEMGKILWVELAPYWRMIIRRKFSNATEEEVEELLQKILEAIWKKLQAGKFKGESRLKTFGSGIAKNKTIDHIHKKSTDRKRFIGLTEAEIANDPEEESEEEELSKKALVGRLTPLFDLLRDICQYLLRKRSEGLTWQEIAEEINASSAPGFDLPVKAENLRNQWTRCLKRLTKLILDKDPELLPILQRNRTKRGRQDNG